MMLQVNRFLVLLAMTLILASLLAIEGRISLQAPAEPLAVQLSHPTGYYEKGIRLRMDVADPEAVIRFTTDGSQPKATNGAAYERPLFLAADPESVVVVRARAVAEDGTLGPEESATYILGLEATLPVVSLIVEPDDLWSGDRGIFTNPGNKGPEWERATEIVYLDESKRVGFGAPGGLRVHGGQSRWIKKKSFRLYFRSEYGMNELEYPLFPDGELTRFKRLILDAGGQDQPNNASNGTLLRKPLVAALAKETEVIVSETQYVLLYINGQPWGAYILRERMDPIYFADRFGVGDLDILGSLVYDPEPLAGDWAHWDELMAYVASNDLNDPDHYDYVTSQIAMDNFIDFHALLLLTGNLDWPQRSQDRFHPHVQGGKWHWFLWDSDITFGLTFGDGVLPDPTGWLLTEDKESQRKRIAQEEDQLFRKLMEVPEFKLAFVRRMESLLNTTFQPEAIVAELDMLADEVSPNMDQEIQRWHSSGDWAANVEQMRQYAYQRPEIIRQYVIEELALTGTVHLEFGPAKGGSVIVNGMLLPELPWSGVFFTGVPIEVKALPGDGYRFIGWEPTELPQTEAITLTNYFPERISPRFERVSG
jgi:hypothetical protein